jgi:heat shock protein HslJ
MHLLPNESTNQLEETLNKQLIFIAWTLLVWLTACSSGQKAAAPTQAPTSIAAPATAEPTPAPTAASTSNSLADTLGNLSYTGLFPDQPITLTQGYATYDSGGAGQPFVRLLDQLVVQGDLNGDGAADAVVLLEDQASGSGHFIWAAAVLDALRHPTPTEAVMIGDRIAVKSLMMDGAQVVADIVAQGTGDVTCCGTWNVRKVFALQDGRLAEQSSQELSKVSLSDLNGTHWRLVDLNSRQEPALPDVAVTLQIADGQLSGSAGCNNYNSALSGSADDPSVFLVGPVAATKKLCPDPLMNQETTYLTRLGQVKAWKYDAGQLALLYASDNDVLQYLVFEPAAESN